MCEFVRRREEIVHGHSDCFVRTLRHARGSGGVGLGRVGGGFCAEAVFFCFTELYTGMITNRFIPTVKSC